MTNSHWFYRPAFGISLLLLLGACAPMAADPMSSKSAASTSSGFQDLGGGNGTGTSTRITGVPAYTPTVSGTGYTSTTFTVQTNSILKVKFRAGTPGCIANTNFCPRYSKLGVYVGISTNTEPTGMIGNGYMSAQEESAVIDLSSKFTHTCGADVNCRQSVTIQIEKPNSDTFCLGVSGCWYHVQSGHPWSGTLVVETDDTNSI